MKPTTALKPLVFALAAVMAVAAQAGGYGTNDIGAGASVNDVQRNSNNSNVNQGTRNDARVESSANGSQGNLGANAAAGVANQQDNAVAIATADERFIFGTAAASTIANQSNTGNFAYNHATSNNASLSNSANGSSGNIGINVTSGSYNQQKNNLAIAVSAGRVASASAGANQSTSGLSVENRADRSYEVTTLSTTTNATGTYKGTGSGYIEQSGYGGTQRHPIKIHEEGTFGLAGSSSYQVLTPTGWRNPVTNTATLNNSLNGVSGNVGANVSAGTSNQQSNSLAIAAGCQACK
ncbi:hypothetical protein [Pseudomonas cremoricolorata]|uniref:hypothetical protein n=1 Tax=Pseudomonas cremoricolorata TaxID=157783 RepID=UPI00040B2474|nr:hypothetical protein [Pseudomonas cremoricolorata]